MLKNYLKVAYRNLLRHKFYSAITVLGLAVGITCTLFIVLFIQDELRYDRFHSKAERIYRVVEKLEMDGGGEESVSQPFPVARMLRNDYPHLVEDVVRFFNFQQPRLTLAHEQRKFNEKGLFFADSTVFNVFDFELQQGNPATALAGPNKIVLTESLARKYFGTTDVMGKILKFEGQFDLLVTGVAADVPQQSHIHFDGLISFATATDAMMGGNTKVNKNWVWNPCWTYVLLKPEAQPQELEAAFPEFADKYFPEFMKGNISFYLQPLTRIHLHSDLDYEIEPNGNVVTLYILGAIGIFLLLIAAINFMNLTTARAAGRAREVGVRKATGAYRSQLIQQFLTESLLLTFVAVVLALALLEMLLPFFNNIADKQISANLLTNPALLIGLLAAGILTGIGAGMYPAFFLSAFNPVSVLKGKVTTGSRSSISLRKGLVILQFTTSLVLIMGTLLINKQLKYMQQAELGFEKDQVIILPTRPPMAPKFEAMRQQLLQNPNIQSITTMNEVLGQHHNTHEYNYEGMQQGKWIYFPSLIVNEDFVPTFGMKMAAGRNFSRDFATDDSLGVLINEAMVQHLGWGTPEQAIGKQFFTPWGREKVIGVVKDFNFVSLTQPIGPFVLDMPHKRMTGMWRKYMALRVSATDLPATISHMEKVWNEFAPDFPMEYFFLNEQLAAQYKSQEKLGQLVGYFSILAVFIACLGLFALASFTAEQRTKEIGIRKVLGASSKSIVYLLTKDFTKLVLWAAVLAVPLAWYGMSRWLENFAYRTPVPVWIFVVAVLAGLAVAVITVSYQAVRAALTNPAHSLKSE
ncbi:MAG: ABC transporter permease [Hymenobacteraceae bacterium]|nr:ABC transporter permease [Hymenobacteraceae bacterium]MDX5396837.1 ABC transporter permease [Hymenobacteraceae bacterium]MDX5442795.1 ABC transporter permease [Hymenobacteraceae bacterium]MDX5512908.1 ABC transporter permease [Hymenobacteraceae bacterium]